MKISSIKVKITRIKKKINQRKNEVCREEQLLRYDKSFNSILYQNLFTIYPKNDLSSKNLKFINEECILP